MARPRVYTDEQILGAARKLVLETGPGVSLQEIARLVGATEPAIIKRFGGKQQLFLAALRPPEEPPWIAHIEALPDGRTFEEQLAEILSEMWGFFESSVPCLTALRESGIPHAQILGGARPAPLRAIEAITRFLERARTCGLCAPPPGAALDSVAMAILGALQVRAFLQHVLRQSPGRASSRDYVRHLASLYAQALAPTSSTKKPARRRRARSRIQR